MNTLKITILFLSLFCTVTNISAQYGCTDPQASNYDPIATLNDGSCLYPETTDTLTQITELPLSLKENSGLLFINNNLYTHNDGGNANELYRIDTLQGNTIQTILVIAENEDWEDLAQSDTHIFIGDFGNNGGDRTDLRIYKIAKTELANNIVNAQPINFAYADQIDFSNNHNNHDFDCEAFFYHNDSLHLFTKNWVDNKTRHYAMPAEPGFYALSPQETFDVEGLITSADISEQGVVLLLGYTEVGLNFMWILFDYQGSNFFSGNRRRIELGTALVNSQTEALVFKDTFTGYISSERFSLGSVELPPRLMSFDIEQWLSNVPTTTTQTLVADSELLLSPNPFYDKCKIHIPKEWQGRAWQLKILAVDGKVILDKSIVPFGDGYTLEQASVWHSGIYFLQLINEDTIYQSILVKKGD